MQVVGQWEVLENDCGHGPAVGVGRRRCWGHVTEVEWVKERMQRGLGWFMPGDCKHCTLSTRILEWGEWWLRGEQDELTLAHVELNALLGHPWR